MKWSQKIGLNLGLATALLAPQAWAQTYTAYPVDTNVAATLSLRVVGTPTCSAFNASGGVGCTYIEAASTSTRVWGQYTNPISGIAPTVLVNPTSRLGYDSLRVLSSNRGYLHAGALDNRAALFKPDSGTIFLADAHSVATDVNDLGWAVGHQYHYATRYELRAGITSLFAGASGSITINGYATAVYTATGSPRTDRPAIARLINEMATLTGVTAMDDGSGIGLSAADGRAISVSTEQYSWRWSLREIGIEERVMPERFTDRFLWIPNEGSFNTGSGIMPAVGQHLPLACRGVANEAFTEHNALFINRNGWIAGNCNGSAMVWAAWDPNVGYDLNAPSASWFPEMINLGSGPTPRASALAACSVMALAEEENYIAVQCYTPDGFVSFVNTPSSPFRLSQIDPSPGGYDVAVTSINREGCAIGSMSDAHGRSNPFLYCNGRLTALSSIVDGYTITRAISINESGAILATARAADESSDRYYVFVPGGASKPTKVAKGQFFWSGAVEKILSTVRSWF